LQAGPGSFNELCESDFSEENLTDWLVDFVIYVRLDARIVINAASC